MEQSLQDVEHYARIISGCESINQVATWGGKLTEDGRYAQSVLRVQVQTDLGAFAGTESILSGIKKGAQKLKEWIVNLVKSIVSYLTGSEKKSKETEVESKKLETEFNKLPAEEKTQAKEKIKPLITPLGQVSQRIVDKLEQAKEKGKEFSAIGYTVDMSSAIQHMKGAVEDAEEGSAFGVCARLRLAAYHINAQINSVKEKLASYANGEETPERNAVASKAAAWLNFTTSVAHSVVMNQVAALKKADQALTAFMTGNKKNDMKSV